MLRIHRHIGGLENSSYSATLAVNIHRHIGGLENDYS